MAKIDDDLDANDVEEKLKPKIDNKKALIITIPVLIILASAVSFFTIFREIIHYFLCRNDGYFRGNTERNRA